MMTGGQGLRVSASGDRLWGDCGTLAGQDFDAALALAVSSLTNTGPAAFALDSTFRLVDLSAATHAILCAAMIFGRLEALVIIALFNPDFWRS